MPGPAKRSFSMAAELEGLAITPEMVTRRETLESLLQQHGMTIRDDSRLACQYITTDGDVYYVAHELLCTNFLFTHTNYNNLCQDGLRYIANDVKTRYNLPWRSAWRITREYGVPAMKCYALAESGLAMPVFSMREETCNTLSA